MRDKCTTNADSAPPSVPLDCEDWQIAFEPYLNHPYFALALAQRLTVLQRHLQSDAEQATAELNLAIDALYEHSEFRSVGLELFRVTAQGRLSVAQEKLIRELGIRV